MKNYVKVSLETHLFWARIMKEHALFLQAGFVSKDGEWIRRADFFRRQFEDLLARTVDMSNHMVGKHVLKSDEVVTPYTMDAERVTSRLSGIPIHMRITAVEGELECAHKDYEVSKSDVQMVHSLNERAVWLLNGLIEFKGKILHEVKKCNLYTSNYPSMIEHMIAEARLYREMLEEMMKEKKVCYKKMKELEEFWNHTMMEHAMFIRGLLDPSEEELMIVANDFVNDFGCLLNEACSKDCKASVFTERCDLGDCVEKERKSDCCDNCQTNCKIECNVRKNDCQNDCRNDRQDDCKNDCRINCEINHKSHNHHHHTDYTLQKTCELRDFKATATEGILTCQIKSLILPLLADHVLREANHYIRIQEEGYK